MPIPTSTTATPTPASTTPASTTTPPRTTNPITTTNTTDPERFQPVAAILALLCPGLGHAYLGEPRRALGIAAGILGLFFSGLLIGGIDAIDRRENPVWYAAQSLNGPVAWAANWIHQNRLKVHDPADPQRTPRSPRPDEGRNPDGSARALTPGERPPYSKSLNKMNEMGTLFMAIAGMVNLIAIVDAAMHRGRRRP